MHLFTLELMCTLKSGSSGIYDPPEILHDFSLGNTQNHGMMHHSATYLLEGQHVMAVAQTMVATMVMEVNSATAVVVVVAVVEGSRGNFDITTMSKQKCSLASLRSFVTCNYSQRFPTTISVLRTCLHGMGF